MASAPNSLSNKISVSVCLAALSPSIQLIPEGYLQSIQQNEDNNLLVGWRRSKRMGKGRPAALPLSFSFWLLLSPHFLGFRLSHCRFTEQLCCTLYFWTAGI